MRIIFTLVLLVLTLASANAAQLDLSRVKTSVDFSRYEADTVVISASERRLFYKSRDGKLIAYPVAVGRDGMNWSGTATIQKVAEWPDWVPPADMRRRQPSLPVRMAGGWGNPLGARALYLFEGKRDTLYRIHGTSSEGSIGYPVTSGCIRMLNADVEELAGLVRIGTKVVVLK